jgi:NADH dehydrogenase [ubiquinone] 1 alpha subcomplex assembly factor 7
VGVNALSQRITELIEAEGPLSVAQFTALCLYDPLGGIYAAREPIGRDFITAPEISQMFGEFAGLWAVQAWHDQGQPDKPRLVELGPGRGTLMADALRAIAAAAPDFLSGAEIALVETSAPLRRVQQEKLKRFDHVAWYPRFGEALTDRPLFLIANEFFDCMPIRQFVKTDRGWCERMVTVRDGAPAFALAPVAIDPAMLPPDRVEAPDGGVYEIAPSGLALVEEIAAAIAGHGGAGLIVDYGYDTPGFGETLQAVRGHTYADVLDDPGETDLSAHVDFMAMGRAVRGGGAAAYGAVGQGDWLKALGIAARAERLTAVNPAKAADIAAAVERLTLPDKMGTLFKAMAIAPKGAPRPPGF